MKFTLTAPCAKCPFRTDIQPYLTPGRAQEIATALTARQATFACHETTTQVDPDSDDADGDDYHPSEREQHCAGAMIVLERANKPNQMMRICERIGLYDRRRLRMDAPVFETMIAFVAAQRERRVRAAPTGQQRRGKTDKQAAPQAVRRLPVAARQPARLDRRSDGRAVGARRARR